MIFYEDGTTFSNQDGTPSEAPPTGVIVVLQTSAQGKNVLFIHKDYYCWEIRDDNEWCFAEVAGFWQYMFTYTGKDKAVLFGTWTSDDNFQKIWNEANRVWRELANGE